MNKNWNRPAKNVFRTDTMMKTGKVSRKAIMLPGKTLSCVKAGLKSGQLSRKTTNLIAVERDLKTAAIIDQNLRKMGWKTFTVHTGDIETLNLSGTKVDFAFLDFCGQFSPSIARWLNSNQSHFAVGCRMAFTFSIQGRQRKTLDRLADTFVWSFDPNVLGQALPIHDGMLMDWWSFIDAPPNGKEWDMRLDAKMTSFMMWAWQGVYASLSQFNVHLTQLAKYRDGEHMAYVSLTLGSTKPTPDLLWGKMKDWAGTEKSASFSERAQKAWKTRRANAKTKTNKAWETRRARYGITGLK